MTHDSLALAPPLSGARTRQVFLFGAGLLILMNFASPAGGVIDIPVTFFLRRARKRARRYAMMSIRSYQN
jgi:hypothetical protein